MSNPVIQSNLQRLNHFLKGINPKIPAHVPVVLGYLPSSLLGRSSSDLPLTLSGAANKLLTLSAAQECHIQHIAPCINTAGCRKGTLTAVIPDVVRSPRSLPSSSVFTAITK